MARTTSAAQVKQHFCNRLIEHHRYVREHGEDMPDIRDWHWPYADGDKRAAKETA
jgi:xylulose-5-phosphate/fructose-6-phosphate phosphoketolase